MSNFYTILSHHYDDIFSTNHKAISFIERFITDEDAPILDLGAGTGSEAIEFAKKGYKVFATDLDSEMVRIMNSKKNTYKLHSFSASHGNMKDLEKLLGENFGTIYCIGNTFVHLSSTDEMRNVLNDAFHCLNADGTLIIQIVNYDRIIARNITELPTIMNEKRGIEFKRQYEKDGDYINFRMKLRILLNQNDAHTYESNTRLLPLPSKMFLSLIEQSHFKNYQLFGNFLGDFFTIESPALIAALKK